MKDEEFEKNENMENVDEVVGGTVWTAKRVRANALTTLKDKQLVSPPTPSPPLGTHGGKRNRLEDIAATIQEQQRSEQLNQFELAQQKLQLDRDRLELDKIREERQDKLVAAQIEAMQANSAILLALSEALKKQ